MTLGKVDIPHRTPTTLDLKGCSPQKFHGQNGLIRHETARLLVWSHQP
jgi:hypothetical protein